MRAIFLFEFRWMSPDSQFILRVVVLTPPPTLEGGWGWKGGAIDFISFPLASDSLELGPGVSQERL